VTVNFFKAHFVESLYCKFLLKARYFI